MKTSRLFIALALSLAGLAVTQSAFAWHHGPRVSIGFGFGYPGYPYYYPPYAYYPPYYPAPVVIQRQPTVYVEQASQPAPVVQAPAESYWYYCTDSRAYYPYVRDCASGWQRVAPQPAH